MKDHPQAPLAAKAVFLGRDTAQIADTTGLSMDVIDRWRTERWFQELIVEISDEALEEMASLARGNIFDALQKGDEKIAKWVLERRDKKFFAPSTKLEISGEVNHNHRSLAHLSDDEINAIIAEDEPKPQLEAEFEHFCLPEPASDEAEDVVDAEFEPAE